MDAPKAALVLFVVALLQLAVLTEYEPFRTSSIVLVALLSIALLRGSIFGAVAGFGTGLLLDTATLGTLGLTSLLLTVGGFWIGRYGETTTRDRFHAPFVSVAVVTVLYSFGQIALQCGPQHQGARSLQHRAGFHQHPAHIRVDDDGIGRAVGILGAGQGAAL